MLYYDHSVTMLFKKEHGKQTKSELFFKVRIHLKNSV